MGDQPYNVLSESYIALYCRVSTDEQAREGVSLDEQQERLKAYCRAMGWNGEIVLFIDDGYSAKNMERPQLVKLLHQVEKGTISKVLVTKLDRMSRRLLDLLQLIDLLHQHSVSFISISESFDTHTPSGRLTLQVLGAVAEFERERIRERVFENMLHSANQGKWLTQSPYGYDLKEKELVINNEESEIVKRVFDLYLDKGWGYYSIAKQLNGDGIPSKQKKEWSVRSIKLMLTNPVYKGTLVWNRIDRSKSKEHQVKDDEDWVVIDDVLPVIIDKEIWESVQKKISTKQKMHPRSETSPHLLGGFLKCGRCGAGMSISWMGPRTKRWRVYRCSANKNKGTCTSKSYKSEEVENWFKQGLLNLSKTLDHSFILQLAMKAKKDEQHTTQQRIQTAKNRYKRKVEAYTAGLIELKDLQEEKDRMEAFINEASESKSSNEINIKELEAKVNEKLQTIVDAIDTIPVVEAKALVRTLVEKVILYDEKDIEIVLQPTP
jgi:site-specific DNA recombinase